MIGLRQGARELGFAGRGNHVSAPVTLAICMEDAPLELSSFPAAEDPASCVTHAFRRHRLFSASVTA